MDSSMDFELIPILRRRGFLGLAAVLTAGAAAACSSTGSAPPRPPAPNSTSEELARELLLVGDNNVDLKLQYLQILVNRGLPKTTSPKRVLIVGAGVSGLVA